MFVSLIKEKKFSIAVHYRLIKLSRIRFLPSQPFLDVIASVKFKLLTSPSFAKIHILSILFLATRRDQRKFPASTAVAVLAFPSSYLKVPIIESATFSFRIRLPSTRIPRIRQRIRKKNKSALQSGKKNKTARNPITCGRVNPDIFESNDVESVFSLSPNNKLIWRHNVSGEQSKFPATILLYGACSEDILMQRSLGY